MAQVKVYGHRAFLAEHRLALSDAIHRASVGVLGLPQDKRFHRFLGLDDADFIHPAGRSEAYVILEVHLLAGRQDATLRAYLRALQSELAALVPADDLEVVLLETPPARWSIRGQVGDALALPYEVTR